MENKKPVLSKMAVTSFLLTSFGLFNMMLCLSLDTHELVRTICAWIVFFAIPAGAALGIISDSQIRKGKGIFWRRFCSLSSLSIVGIIIGIALLLAHPHRIAPPRIVCTYHLGNLVKAILLYAEDVENVYPETEDWCDLLVQHSDIHKKEFICPEAVKYGDEGPCHYAMNPNCKPDSPNDVVLLFETKGGWNQFGGPELLTFENHKPKGVSVGYNDGHVEFIKPEEIDKLKWKAEDVNNVK
ncbi:MAG: hypothetical protein JW749_04080 [Sedimentisphaerales bacterium]|nr:hypothetical protein [Sedimentisphaerales bacterium]